MFAQTLAVTLVCPGAPPRSVPLAWLDSFAMRNFTNDAVFDDTLPVADGLLEAGFLVPLPALGEALESWCHRKSWLPNGCSVHLALHNPKGEASPSATHPTS